MSNAMNDVSVGVCATQSIKMKELDKGVSLINSEEQERLYPDTWQHPAASTLTAIRKGDIVKVGVEGPEFGGERFWTIVQEVSEAGLLVSVNNKLLFTSRHGLKLG